MYGAYFLAEKEILKKAILLNVIHLQVLIKFMLPNQILLWILLIGINNPEWAN